MPSVDIYFTRITILYRGKIMRFKMLRSLAAAAVITTAALASAQSDMILKPADVTKLLPASVYYKGQSAPTQLRNSSGIKFSDGSYVLATMVDNSGYSSDVAAKYQAYFVAEVPVKILGKPLPAGVYGAGVVSGKFVVTDVGGHDVLTAPTSADDSMKHPLPLQIVSSGGGYRLYLGRQFVTLSK
jgi:hypothetical protein